MCDVCDTDVNSLAVQWKGSEFQLVCEKCKEGE